MTKLSMDDGAKYDRFDRDTATSKAPSRSYVKDFVHH